MAASQDQLKAGSRTSILTGSHLKFVDKLPEDCIRIESYLEHTFENLYYSPSLNTFYQAPKIKYRQLDMDKTSFYCRADTNRTVRISIKKMKKQISAKHDSSE